MDPTLQTVLTVGGLSAVVSILEEIIVRAVGPDFDTDRWGPLLALLLGVVIALVASYGLDLVTKASIMSAALTGIVAGGAAMGIHDATTSVANSANP
jgi:uncharacterized membrane protein (DUF441 family)